MRIIDPHPLYIALDFDGVLHHQNAGPLKSDHFDPLEGTQEFKRRLEARFSRTTPAIDFWDADGLLFDREHHLCDLLHHIPQARIVFATTWRNEIPLTHLTSFLSPAIQGRVVGALDVSNLEGQRDGVRGELMTQWLEHRDEADAVWVALDDQARHYQQHPEQIIQTHWRGMDEITVKHALEKIHHLLHRQESASAEYY